MLRITKDQESSQSHLLRCRTLPFAIMSNRKGLFSLAFGSDEPSDIEIDSPPQAPTPSIPSEPLSEPTNISVEPVNPRPIVPPVTKPHTSSNPQNTPNNPKPAITPPKPRTPIPTIPITPTIAPSTTPVMSTKCELKAALPADFSGKSSDAS